MKKILFWACSALLIFHALSAAPVPLHTVREIALRTYTLQDVSSYPGKRYQITAQFKLTAASQIPLHIFEINQEGCVLMSADDALPPVLGISHHGRLSFHDLPDGLRWLLKGYIDLSSEMKGQAPTTTTRQAWQAAHQLLQGHLTAGPSAPLPPSFGPLLTTTWNQTCNYNANCPADGGGSCGRTYTGCGATAMAQVMKYMAWPDSGFGSHSYTPAGYPLQSVNYQAAGYNWVAMPNALGGANAEVAKLMHHCGVAVEMMYSTTSSNCYFSDLDNAMRAHFRYSLSTRGHSKILYTDPAWDALLQGEINASRPMLFNGGTHFWVLDGYQTGPLLYHMNWGWGGTYNGWYALTNLNPGSLTFSNSGVVAGILPAGPFEVEGSNLSFPVGGGPGQFEVVSDSAWTSTSSAAWLSASPSSGGKGYAQVIATTLPNPTYTTRTAYIALTRGNLKDTVWVDQAPILPSLGTWPSLVMEGASGGIHSISVTSDSIWIVSGASPWLSYAPASGTGAGTVSLTIAANAGGARTGFLAFQRGTRTDTVLVDQSGSGTVWCVPPVGVPTAVGISKVVIKTLSRSSGISEGYLLAPDSTKLYRDSTYSIHVTFSGSVAPAIWLDWNQDGDFFDTGEAIIPPSGSWYPTFGGTKTTSFLVPSAAGLGMTRMRVYTKTFPGPSSGPCAGTSVGDVEDFNVWILNSGLLPSTALKLLVQEPHTLTWDFDGDESALRGFEVEMLENGSMEVAASLAAQDRRFEVERQGWYRLRALMDDGSSHLSTTVHVNGVPEQEVLLGPNPVAAGNDITVQIPGEPIRSMVLHDLQGRQLWQVSGLSTDFLRISTSGLSKGNYFVTITTAKGVLRRKVQLL